MAFLTVIIPVVPLDSDEKKNFFKEAVKSVSDKDVDILVIGSSEALATVEGDGFKTVQNDGETDYVNQVNAAVREVKTKYFSVLEFDDRFSSIWFSNLKKYIEVDENDTFAFLPLTEVIDHKYNDTVGYANEAVWALSFTDELGCYNLECLENYLNFNTSGGAFKTEEFISLGGLKPSIKLVFWYEFLYRAIYKEKRVYVIPKVGYYHTANRDGSITDTYNKTMDEKEAEWWIDLAKKEYFFPQDRKKTYEKE